MDETTRESNYVHVKNQSKLTFKGMLNRKDLSDVKLCCGNDEFFVHRFMLAACSPYFRSIFQKSSANKLNIVLNNMNSDDLQRVLHYMYEGSALIKNDDLQAFGELLEMFLMPLPDELMVTCDENAKNDVQDVNESSMQNVRDDIDEFVADVRVLLDKITPENIEKDSLDILQRTKLSTSRLKTVVNMILELVIKLTANCSCILLGSLVKNICSLDSSHMFEQFMRQKSLHVLQHLTIASPMQHKPPELNALGNANSLDKEVIRIKTIEYHSNVVRRRRFTHFVKQLFLNNVINSADISNIQQSHPSIASDLIDNPKCQTTYQCDLEIPTNILELIHNKQYQYALEIENHLMWLRIENDQNEPRKFNALVKQPPVKRTRKRKRLNKPRPSRKKNEHKAKVHAAKNETSSTSNN